MPEYETMEIPFEVADNVHAKERPFFTTRLVIIGAEAQEVKPLVDRLEMRREEKHYNRTYYTGELAGIMVAIAECGVGKGNAASATQMMLDLFPSPWAVINVGVGGGVSGLLNIGDVVLGEWLAQWDFDLTALFPSYARGQLPGGTREKTPTWFHGDPAILAGLKKAVEAVAPDRKAVLGNIVSGDSFVASRRTRQMLRDEFKADVAEMEGAAIAQVASNAGVPFAIVRAVSDKADGEAPDSFMEFSEGAALVAANAICKYLEDL